MKSSIGFIATRCIIAGYAARDLIYPPRQQWSARIAIQTLHPKYGRIETVKTISIVRFAKKEYPTFPFGFINTHVQYAAVTKSHMRPWAIGIMTEGFCNL